MADMTRKEFELKALLISNAIIALEPDPVLRVQAMGICLCADAINSRGKAPEDYRKDVAKGMRDIADDWEKE